MIILVGIIIAFVLGFLFGMLIMALCAAAGQTDDQLGIRG